jgi:hypothetical protein
LITPTAERAEYKQVTMLFADVVNPPGDTNRQRLAAVWERRLAAGKLKAV